MKKFIALFVSSLMILSLAACGGQDSGSNASNAQLTGESETLAGSGSEDLEQEQTTEENTQESVEQPGETNAETVSESETSDEGNSDSLEEIQEVSDTETKGGEGKTLVVYYSATGNTKDVGSYIAAATSADVLELEPVEPYSSDDLNWRDENSRVVYEHDNPDARAVELMATTVEDWESYETVFIGYPIWWGIAAWPVDGFIAANDFTGKTVVPFCTSSSSGLGESGELLAEAAGTGNWLEGKRFSSGASEEEVQEWVAGLGL